MVRDYVKWDDLPISLPHFAESAVRAYKIAMTPPMMPVVLVADGELQENPIATDAKLRISEADADRPRRRAIQGGGRSGAAAGGGGKSGDYRGPRGAHASRDEATCRAGGRRCRRR